MTADTLQSKLTALSKKMLALSPDDKDGIASCGCDLEACGGDVPSEFGAISNLIGQVLQTLQKTYLGELSDAPAALAAAGDGLALAADTVKNEDADAQELRSAVRALSNMIGEQTTEAPAPKPKPKPVEAPPVGIPSLDDVAAMLMVLCAEEISDIRRLDDQLTLLLQNHPSLPGSARKELFQASNLIGTILAGVIADPDSLLTEIGRHFATAQDLVDTAQEASEEAQAAAEEPAAAPVVEEAPAPEEAPAEEPTPATSEAPQAAEEEPAKPAPAANQDDLKATLPQDTDEELLQEYIVECMEHIGAAEASLLDIETDPEATEPINTVFRAFHTIKGTSGFLGLDMIQKLAHLAETLLDRAREGEIQITGGYADLCLESCDTLKAMISSLQSAVPGQDLSLPDHLASLLDQLANPEAAGFSSEDSPKEPTPRVGDILVAQGAVSREDVEEAAAKETSEPIGKTLVKEGAASAPQVAKALRVQRKITKTDSSIRVSTGRLDKLMNMVGELVIAQSMIAQDPDVTDGHSQRLSRNVSHAGKIMRELQDLTMALRMVPLKPTFQKMARLVRDLGRKAGKKLVFTTVGEDTEIDRNMVEVLNDPLVHMIRNACDHGVEDPETRAASGKSETGTVQIRAYHSAGNVVIELIDDGKGLNKDAILKKAIERGIVSPNTDMTDQEMFMLVFKPGFSTAEKVTDISGRGVGMDVVKRNIESIRGRVEVTSTLGKGSKFTIRLPLTMAITDAMLLKVGNERYLLPTVSIEQSFRADKSAVTTVVGKGEMVMLRNELIPILRIHRVFRVGDAITDFTKGIFIALEAEGRRCALFADELLDQQQVVVKSLGSSLGRIAGVSGGAILGDGNVGLILDPSGLFALSDAGAGIKRTADETASDKDEASPGDGKEDGAEEPEGALAAGAV
jgi:two-component system, chemotaxis family, sensor kinase CheA